MSKSHMEVSILKKTGELKELEKASVGDKLWPSVLGRHCVNQDGWTLTFSWPLTPASPQSGIEDKPLGKAPCFTGNIFIALNITLPLYKVVLMTKSSPGVRKRCQGEGTVLSQSCQAYNSQVQQQREEYILSSLP